MTQLPPGALDDGDNDDLAAMDFVAPQRNMGEASLAAILDFEPPTLPDAPERGGAAESFGYDASAEDIATPVFTIANPPGTVAVTAVLDGRVHYVDLSPDAGTMTETVLAEEIVIIADLATQEARSAQYTWMLEGMREHGHDPVGTRDFLTRELELPSPEQAQQARVELFAARYQGDE